MAQRYVAVLNWNNFSRPADRRSLFGPKVRARVVDEKGVRSLVKLELGRVSLLVTIITASTAAFEGC
jgi:hypothetical protein